ncbi:MAG: transcriptional repressor LexA [Oscillospiraceae bacterium]|nr:transcriptional repressor LexA [Oscillospiraceae bacterium]
MSTQTETTERRPSTKPLTKPQRKVFEFLKSEVRRNGYPPAIREICVGLNLSSTSTVHSHLKTLEKKGYIRRSKAKFRSIEILEKNFYEGPLFEGRENDDDREIVKLPVVGNVAAGAPILAEENIEDTFPVPAEYLSGGTNFMLRVKGDSMVDAGIFHRDLIIVREQPNADNGDIVVAIIDDEATVKYFYREHGFMLLKPANAAYKDIRTPEATVVGKVIGLFRRF